MVTTVQQPNGKHEGAASSDFESICSYSTNALPSNEISSSPRTVTFNLTVEGAPHVEVVERPQARNIFLVWLIVTLRIMWSSLRHPGHPVWIDRRTGDVWLKRD